MNYNRKVLQLVLLISSFLLVISLFFSVNSGTLDFLRNINIISNIVRSNNTADSSVSKKDSIKFFGSTSIDSSIQNATSRNIQHFETADRLTNFSLDTTTIVLPSLIKKMLALKRGEKVKIRIAFLGDSMIEGDLVTQTVRQLLQKEFGGYGVGFVPITSVVAGFRSTVKSTFSNTWKEFNFKNKTTATPLYLSGRVFYATNYSWSEADDKTIPIVGAPLQKKLLCGYRNGSTAIIINKSYRKVAPYLPFNSLLLDSSSTSKFILELTDNQLPIFGLSFESGSGVIVDNFSFRGSGGFEFAQADTTLLNAIAQQQPYDLIVMQYGVNLLNHPNNTQFNWYYTAMSTAIKKLKKCFATTEFLLVSSADKSFHYSNGTHTAIGMDSLIAVQEKIAFENNLAFYNTYQSMGGYNSMVNWVNGNPSLAAKDFTHLNNRGAAILGNSIFNSIMFEFHKPTH